jgi:hypothetical protein
MKCSQTGKSAEAGRVETRNQASVSIQSYLWRSPGLVDPQHPAKAGPGKTTERRRVQTVTGADLGEADLILEIIGGSTHPRALMIPKIVDYALEEVEYQKMRR